jgi:hypothetical protein
MKYYNKIKTTELDFTIIEKARKFAQDVYSTTNYSDSNQFSNQKIMNDHFISKIGEEAAKKVLGTYALVDGPDYNIYDVKQKSWSDDLYINKIGIAVKTQKRSAALKYSLSWTFQSGIHRRDTVLDKPNAWVVFVEYDDLHPHICYVYPPFQIKELKFGEPMLDHLKGHKKVVYATSLLL